MICCAFDRHLVERRHTRRLAKCDCRAADRNGKTANLQYALTEHRTAPTANERRNHGQYLPAQPKTPQSNSRIARRRRQENRPNRDGSPCDRCDSKSCIGYTRMETREIKAPSTQWPLGTAATSRTGGRIFVRLAATRFGYHSCCDSEPTMPSANARMTRLPAPPHSRHPGQPHPGSVRRLCPHRLPARHGYGAAP